MSLHHCSSINCVAKRWARFLVSQGKTKAVNFAAWLGTSVLLTFAFVSIQNHLRGAIGMVAAMSTELGCLAWQLRRK